MRNKFCMMTQAFLSFFAFYFFLLFNIVHFYLNVCFVLRTTINNFFILDLFCFFIKDKIYFRMSFFYLQLRLFFHSTAYFPVFFFLNKKTILNLPCNYLKWVFNYILLEKIFFFWKLFFVYRILIRLSNKERLKNSIYYNYLEKESLEKKFQKYIDIFFLFFIHKPRINIYTSFTENIFAINYRYSILAWNVLQRKISCYRKPEIWSNIYGL